MKGKNTVLLIILGCIPLLTIAQAVTTAPAYKHISSEGYLRLSYENDFFAATDRYYTQGVDAELVHPEFYRLLTNRLFIKPGFSYTRYGIGVQHNGYTPSSLGHDNVIYGDRPFAGVLMAKTFMIAIDSAHKQRFHSAIHGGVIGPAALAGQMQTSIHKALANIMPRGWDNQIHNDLVLNYGIGYEKQLLGLGRYLSVSAAGNLNIGTLNCSASFGSTIMAGYFLSPYDRNRNQGRSFQIYFYEYPELYLPGYDATLQGGVLNRTTPYVIKETNIERPVLRNRMGFVIAWQGIYLEYFATTISKEFKGGLNQAWGGVQLGVGL